MALVLDGTNGVSGVDGTASNPAIEGTDSNTGIFYPAADTWAVATGGTERVRVVSAGDVGVGTSTPATISNRTVLSINNASNGGALNLLVNGTETLRLLTDNSSFGYVYNVANQPLLFGTNNTERGRFSTAGNLLLGVTSDSGLTAGGDFALKNGASIRFRNAADSAYLNMINVDSSNNLNFGVGGVPVAITFGISGVGEAARFSSGGNLLVGTTSSGGKITVNDGNVHINWGGGYFNSLDRGMTIVAGGYNDTTNKARVVHVGGIGDNNNRCGWTAYGIKTAGVGNGSQYYLRPVTWTGSAFAEQGSAGVYLADNATSWTSASDERLKDIIEPITDAANKVASLRAVIGKYKTDDEGTRRTFLIAQDVQAVLPEAVKAQEDEQCTLGLAYTDTIPLLVAAIKEQQAMIDELKAKVAALENA